MRPDDHRLCRGCPQRGDPESGAPGFLPEIPEEEEAFRLLWPLPPLRAGFGGPIGLDMAEVSARIRPGFDPGRIVALVQAAEGTVLSSFLKKAAPRDD